MSGDLDSIDATSERAAHDERRLRLLADVAEALRLLRAAPLKLTSATVYVPASEQDLAAVARTFHGAAERRYLHAGETAEPRSWPVCRITQGTGGCDLTIRGDSTPLDEPAFPVTP